MPKMIQVRNVPEALHRRLKAHAAMEGRSLSDYLLTELQRIGERPTRKELMDRLAEITRADLVPSAAEILRAERASR